MKQAILNFPQQFKVGVEKAQAIEPGQNFRKIAVCGMGGSALPPALLTAYLQDLQAPLYIHRSYGLPSQVDNKTLVICISFSGNTEETLSAYETAVEKRLNPIAITTGGKLQEKAENQGLPLILIPNDGLQPRCATGYLFSALLTLLAKSGIIKDKSSELLALEQSLAPAKLAGQGQELAQKLVNKIPIIYADNRYKALARIWKIKFNENSKTMAFWNYFPELNHNEMVGYTSIKYKVSSIKYKALILRDNDGHPRILKRMRLTADLIREKGAEAEFIDLKGNNVLEKMFNSLLLGDWTSYYLALNYNQDPEPVKIVEDFKQRLKKT